MLPSRCAAARKEVWSYHCVAPSRGGQILASLLRWCPLSQRRRWRRRTEAERSRARSGAKVLVRCAARTIGRKEVVRTSGRGRRRRGDRRRRGRVGSCRSRWRGSRGRGRCARRRSPLRDGVLVGNDGRRRRRRELLRVVRRRRVVDLGCVAAVKEESQASVAMVNRVAAVRDRVLVVGHEAPARGAWEARRRLHVRRVRAAASCRVHRVGRGPHVRRGRRRGRAAVHRGRVLVVVRYVRHQVRVGAVAYWAGCVTRVAIVGRGSAACAAAEVRAASSEVGTAAAVVRAALRHDNGTARRSDAAATAAASLAVASHLRLSLALDVSQRRRDLALLAYRGEDALSALGLAAGAWFRARALSMRGRRGISSSTSLRVDTPAYTHLCLASTTVVARELSSYRSRSVEAVRGEQRRGQSVRCGQLRAAPTHLKSSALVGGLLTPTKVPGETPMDGEGGAAVAAGDEREGVVVD